MTNPGGGSEAAAAPVQRVTPPPPPVIHYVPPQVSIAPGNRTDADRMMQAGTKAENESRLKDAIANYQGAVKLDPSDFEACVALGMIALKAEEYSTALEALNHAVLLKPDSADARYGFAYALQKKGYFQDAADESEKLLAQHPSETRAHLLVGNLYAQQLGQPDLAREHYKKVLDTDPHNAQATAIRFWLQANP